MDECNGTEFERTANVLDLSYVPEGMGFEHDEIKCVSRSWHDVLLIIYRDEAKKELKGYKGNEFVTGVSRWPHIDFAQPSDRWTLRLCDTPRSN